MGIRGLLLRNHLRCSGNQDLLTDVGVRKDMRAFEQVTIVSFSWWCKQNRPFQHCQPNMDYDSDNGH